ncbi:type III secretion system chaperone [Cognatiyoonia sp. IB215182]|uniref:type III secretion system chaperone n=1 Tax=Cognatiyoonia sp. IB215182 TaxID=3097353 RepID=UPI002A105E4C|nr:type III secretion system chaperone [Cognatiyoonia sp. IB215182]MDX8355150.1 type III secretion system chaperone [Cognatiyoonia sp. IB215182]
MTQVFRDTVQALWQRADLGAPSFASDGSASLIFDDVALTLANSDDEQALVVSTELGQLPVDAAGDADRLQRILGLGLALLPTHDVLVFLQGDRLTVSGTYRYASEDVALLASLLSDVVSAAQTLQGQMGETIAPRLRPVARQAADDIMIFQP